MTVMQPSAELRQLCVVPVFSVPTLDGSLHIPHLCLSKPVRPRMVEPVGIEPTSKQHVDCFSDYVCHPTRCRVTNSLLLTVEALARSGASARPSVADFPANTGLIGLLELLCQNLFLGHMTPP